MGDFEKKLFLRFAMGLFSPSHAFSGGFWQISLKRSLYVKNWKKPFLRPLFRATFPLNTDLNSSSGSPWDPLGPPGGVPQGPRGGIKVGKLLGIMVTGGCFPYVIYEQPLRGEQVLQCNDLWSHPSGLPCHSPPPPLTRLKSDWREPTVTIEIWHKYFQEL